MKVISARSPYQVVVNQNDQIATKVELYIWNKDVSEPPQPTYTFSEKIASITQRETNYNISPYILEYIKQTQNFYTGFNVIEENDSNWCLAKVKTYSSTNGLDFDLVTDSKYVCVNGYTTPDEGVNYDICGDQKYVLLANRSVVIQHSNPIYYYNFLCEADADEKYKVVYYKGDIEMYTETFLDPGILDYYNFRIPLSLYDSDNVKITLGDVVIEEFSTQLVEECKYDPVFVAFVNRYGGWQPLMFFKASQNSIDTKSTEYKLMPGSINYNYLDGQTKSMNLNGTKTIKCNTGWVDENYGELITELLLSDTILVNYLPAIVKTKNVTLATYLKDKNINYTIEFEFSNNILNDIV
jgi:hypothetical protein